MKVLITQIYCYASIAIAKLLKRNSSLEIELWATDKEKVGYASGSLLVDRFVQSPDITDKHYTTFIKHLYMHNQIDFIISVDEQELLIFCKEDLHHECNIVLPSLHILELFTHKKEASLEIQKLGIEIPPIITDLSKEKKIIFRKNQSVGSQGIYVVDLENTQMIENHFNSNEFIQRYINGDEYTVDILSDINGKPKIIIPRKRLEIRNGISFKTQLIHDATLISLCENILKRYPIPGLCNIQFIKANNRYYFIELNPRFAGSGITGIVASFNYIELYLRHFLLKEKMESFEYYMDKVVWNSVITRYYEELVLFPD